MKTEARLRELDQERQRLEDALEREREEKERIEIIEKQKKLESQQIMNMRYQE